MYFGEKPLFSATSTFEPFTCPVGEELSLSHTLCQVEASHLLWGLHSPRLSCAAERAVWGGLGTSVTSPYVCHHRLRTGQVSPP